MIYDLLTYYLCFGAGIVFGRMLGGFNQRRARR